MKLTMTKSNGTKLIKKFRDSDVEAAKENGWTELDAKPQAKKSKKTSGGK